MKVHILRHVPFENIGSMASWLENFKAKRNIIGLQFHIEVTRESVRAILDNCGGELVPGPHIQSESELRRIPGAAYFKINRLMDEVLSYVTHKPFH